MDKRWAKKEEKTSGEEDDQDTNIIGPLLLSPCPNVT